MLNTHFEYQVIIIAVCSYHIVFQVQVLREAKTKLGKFLEKQQQENSDLKGEFSALQLKLDRTKQSVQVRKLTIDAHVVFTSHVIVWAPKRKNKDFVAPL